MLVDCLPLRQKFIVNTTPLRYLGKTVNTTLIFEPLWCSFFGFDLLRKRKVAFREYTVRVRVCFEQLIYGALFEKKFCSFETNRIPRRISCSKYREHTIFFILFIFSSRRHWKSTETSIRLLFDRFRMICRYLCVWVRWALYVKIR